MLLEKGILSGSASHCLPIPTSSAPSPSQPRSRAVCLPPSPYLHDIDIMYLLLDHQPSPAGRFVVAPISGPATSSPSFAVGSCATLSGQPLETLWPDCSQH